MSILLNNKILQATENEIEKRLLPDTRADYMKIVVAGMQVAMDKGEGGMLAALRTSRDPVSDCAIGAINLVMLMRHQSRGTMPGNAIPPAAMTLMLQALDFVDKSRISKITVKKLDRATHIFVNHICAVCRVTPQMLRSLGSRVHAVMKDPTQMEVLARRVGVAKDPRASVPTNLPLANPGARNGI